MGARRRPCIVAQSTRGISKPRPTSPPTVSYLTLNFAGSFRQIDPIRSFGHAVSGYTGDSGDLRSAGAVRTHDAALAPGLLRIGLKWDSTHGYPLNGAASGVGIGDDWIAGINAVKAAGGDVVAIVEGDVTVGGTSYPEMGCTPQDAANLVHYYNDNGGQHGGPIKYWVIGNEPEHSENKYDYLQRQTQDGRIYGDLWLELYDAMKTADPTILIGGPTSSSFYGRIRTDISQATNPGAVNQFWNDFLTTTRAGVGRVADIIDFLQWHYYPTGVTAETTATVLSRVSQASAQVLQARAALDAYAPGRGSTVPAILGEFNWSFRSFDGSTDLIDSHGTGHNGKFSMAANTVFIASTYLNLLRQGGWGLLFADVVGPLGMYTRNTNGDNLWVIDGIHQYPHDKPAATRYPAYFGMAMWTGMGKFRRFGGQIADYTDTVGNIQAMASSDGGVFDAIIINRDESTTRNLTITMPGVPNGANVAVWTTNRYEPWDEPTLKRTMTVSGGTLTGLLVPPLTVVRLVVN